MPDEVNLSRLCGAMQTSRLQLKRARVERREAVRQYIGQHWSEEGTKEQVPLNLLSLYVSVVGRNLFAKNPRVMLSTFDGRIKAAVDAMQSWCSREMEETDLAGTLQGCVLDALFSFGVCKVSLATVADSANSGWGVSAGQPLARRVSLGDFVAEMYATDFAESGFIGHRFRVPFDVVQSSEYYGKARKYLAPSNPDLYNEQGDQRTDVLGRGSLSASAQEFEDHIDLWEVYLPRHKLVVTLADSQMTGAVPVQDGGIEEALRVQRWLGPAGGPYHQLKYGIVPDNAMPKAPIQDLIDLHMAVNRIYRKLVNQAERQKEVLPVRGGAVDDAGRLAQAKDGEMFRCDNADSLKPVSYGAPNAINGNFGIHIVDKFSWLAGNLDMMGGLSPQSKTLGQDQLLAQNASRAIADLQDRTVNFTASVARALCWYWWHDPYRTMKVTSAPPGLPELAISRQVTPETRALGRFEDLDIEVDPYSIQHKTPQERLQSLSQLVTQLVMPNLALAAQQGIFLDLGALLTKAGKYLDMPDLMDILNVQEPLQTAGGGGPEEPGMPQQTERTYTRRSLGGETPQNRNAQIMNQLSEAGMGRALDSSANGTH